MCGILAGYAVAFLGVGAVAGFVLLAAAAARLLCIDALVSHVTPVPATHALRGLSCQFRGPGFNSMYFNTLSNEEISNDWGV